MIDEYLVFEICLLFLSDFDFVQINRINTMQVLSIVLNFVVEANCS